MANSIKGITIQIGGDTTGLDKALRGVNSTISNTQKELKAVDKALKLDPGNTELLEQKQRALAKAVEATSTKLRTLKEAQRQAAEQLAAGTLGQDKYDALTREVSKTTAELERAKKAAASFDVGIAKAQATLGKVSTATGNFAQATRGLSAAAGGLLTALGAIGLKAAKTADDLNTMAKQTGLSTAEIQKMQYASEMVDVSVEDMTGALAKLTRNMASTSTGTQAAFQQLGVSVTTATGEMRNSTDVFYEVLAALGNVANETQRDQLAMDLFGRSANQLAGIIDDGGAALKAYGEEAANLGLILDQETLDALNKVNDELDKIKAQAAAELAKTGAAALEALSPVIADVVDKLAALLDWIGRLDASTIETAMKVLAIVAALSVVSGAISSLTATVSTLMTVLPKVAAFMMVTTPELLAIVGILGILIASIGAIAHAWDDMSGLQKAISVLGALAVACAAAAIAVGAVQSALTMGIAAATIVAGVAAIAASVKSATKGTPGAAGASGGGAYSMSGGSMAALTNTATYNTYNNTTTNNYGGGRPQPINVNIDGRTAAQALYDPLQQVSQNRGGNFAR